MGVAKTRGGIKGHHDHPALIEGSLMLAYGMTREAKALFESLLLTQEGVNSEFVSEKSRNQAWFYLGKILMLEQDLDGASEALEHVNADVFKTDEPQLFHEWHYLKAVISQKRANDDPTKPLLNLAQIQEGESKFNKPGAPEKFYNWLYQQGEITAETAQLLSQPEGFIWQAYLRYNQAVESLNEERYDVAGYYLQTLILDLSHWLTVDKINQTELLSLKDQTLLSLGELYLFQNDYEQALSVLKKIQIESVFSGQALFTYAVAASQLEQFGLALQALNTLKDQASFTPWRQQTPYALAFLYEQLGEPELALEAYSAAVNHYEILVSKLEKDQSEVTEQKILSALSLQEKTIEQDLISDQHIPLSLGRQHVANDEYGYLQVDPSDYNYAELLATEPFQLSLRDLHELYKLKFSLNRWEDQLNSFDAMIQTRSKLRTQRIDETSKVMTSQNSEQWIRQQQAFAFEFERESKAENTAFFMDDTQREYQLIIARMSANLEVLAEGEEKALFAKKINRMKAYLSWWDDAQYSVNLWASKKELNGLTHAVTKFKAHRASLEKHISSDDVNQKLSARIKDGKARLENLKLELEKNLVLASEQLVGVVKEELGRQREEIQGYLLSATKAQARLADAVFLNKKEENDK